MIKTHSQRIHAKRRALERFGLVLNRQDIRDIVEKIQTGKSKHVETQSHRVVVKLVEIQGENYKVVYDKNRKTIITFLPQ